MTFYCGECKEECNPTIVDDGIGSYEYWGARYVDTHLVLVSCCCEETVYTNPECTEELSMTEFNLWVAEEKADRMKDLKGGRY